MNRFAAMFFQPPRVTAADYAHIWGDVPALPTDFQPPTMPTLNHANRNRNNASAVPTPAQVRAAREVANKTPAEAGALIHERAVRWEKFESGEAHMHAASWELFLRKTGQL